MRVTDLKAFAQIRLAAHALVAAGGRYLPARVDYEDRWCNCWKVAPEGLTKVVRFPRECAKCNAITAMPFRAGTLAEARTQVDLRCDYCGHELSIEMTPPVLIVTPDRQTDGAASSDSEPLIVVAESQQADDRRNVHGTNMQRMRVGLRGLLMSPDEAHTVSVLYSLDGHRTRGRMRPLNPSSRFPAWLDPESRLTLHGYDGLPLDIRITVVKIPLQDWKDDDHFAEFVVRHVTA